jgi:short-subunit dehydrogenase involved in D-alanine esterification of teichoic acids
MVFPLTPNVFGHAGRISLVTLCLVTSGAALAQDASKPVYRCPGPPVLYTDALSAAEAREKGCRVIEGAAITVVQTPQRARPSAGAAASTARPGEARVDPAAQRARDSDARRILADELRTEEERLAALQKEYNSGEPERRGDERNFQKYTERVAEMKAAITRKEADIAALKRELAKLPP